MGTELTAVLPLDMRALVDALPDCVLVIDTAGVVRFANRATESQLGHRAADWVGRSVLDLIHPDDVATVLSSIQTVQGKEVGTPVEVRARDAGGAWHWYEQIGSNVLLDDGTSAIVCVARNITERRMWEVAGDDVARFRQILQVAPAITLLLDAQGVVTSVNAAFTRLLGHDPSNVIGQPFLAFITEASGDAAQVMLERVRADGRSVAFEAEMTVVGQQEATRPVRFEMVNLVTDPVVNGIVVSGYDVTELAIVRDELEYLAGHDALTGLTTRAQLVKHVEQQLAARQPFAVLFIDLDRFKPVNDLWGHEVGDEILRLVGGRLEQSVRAFDVVARVGGDEFVVVARDVHDTALASDFANRIEQSISAPYRLETGVIRIGASVGISLSSDGATVAGMLADADLAMYDTKAERRGSSGRSMVERKRSAVERRRLADDFVAGLPRGEIVAHLQPIVDTKTQQVVGFEALARWEHPQLGSLLPAAFIELVEDAGLGVELGDAILESACATMSRLGSHGHVPTLSINLSVGQLTDPGLAERVSRMIARHGLTAARLVIEITELAILAPLGPVGGTSCDQTLRALHALGAMLSLDDFGTGFSSLTHVRRFPLGAIKIDRSFVAGMCTNPHDRAVVEVIIGLARALDLLVVAEGVEHVEQLLALDHLGCNQVQGHLIAGPMSPEEIVPWTLHRAARGDQLLAG